MADNDRLWTKRDVASYLGVSTRTVENMAIPRVALPGRGKQNIVRYDPAKVKAWVEARSARPATAAQKKLQRVG